MRSPSPSTAVRTLVTVEIPGSSGLYPPGLKRVAIPPRAQIPRLVFMARAYYDARRDRVSSRPTLRCRHLPPDRAAGQGGAATRHARRRRSAPDGARSRRRSRHQSEHGREGISRSRARGSRRRAPGLLAPTEGTISVLGRDPLRSAGVLAKVGYVAQGAPLYRSFSVAETIEFARRTNAGWEDEAATDLLTRIDSKTKVGSLSEGD